MGGGGEALGAGSFAVVVYDGLLTRSRNPREAVCEVAPLVGPGGLLVISSDNSWDAAVTPRNSWLGGFKMNGEDQHTITILNYTLKAQFELLEAVDLPRATHDSERSLSLDIMQVSFWRKK